ncbi:MAG: serpin family protein [Pirellulales bacterium]
MQRQIDWQLSDESLTDFAARLKSELDCEVLIEKQALEDLGVDAGWTLQGELARISLQHALEHLLHRHELDWTIEGRALVISTQESIEQQLIVRVYDVRDLVVTGNVGQTDFETLIEVMLSNVAADTWAENGGGQAEVGSIHLDGLYALVVTQSFRNHRQIAQLFSDIRQLRGPNGAAGQPAIGWEELQSKLKLFADELSADETSSEPATAPDPLMLGSPAFEDAIARCNDFSFDLFRNASRDTNSNQMLSGYSAREMLALASYGANGTTRRQFEQALRLPNSRQTSAMESLSIRSSVFGKSSHGEFLVANSVWIQSGLPLENQFTSLAETFMNASIKQVDFGASASTANEINRWAAENTRDRITKVIDEAGIDASAPCLLANAVYFLGRWESPFAKEQTEPSAFRLTTGETIQVPTMHGRMEARGAIDEETGVTIGELFYGDNSKSMVILLPADRPGKLEELEQSLTHEKLQSWLRNLPIGTVQVEMPRFSFQGSYDLNTAIAELGVRDAFDRAKADFSGIAPRGLFLQQVRQITFIQVDETGTEAAAVTTGGFGGPTREATDLILNRPFLFLIRDVKTGCILFVGRVVDPR